MKTKYWLMIFGAVASVCIALSLPLLRTEQARFAKITSKGVEVKTIDLLVDQEFTVDGKNTVTVKDGKIAVTWAEDTIGSIGKIVIIDLCGLVACRGYEQ